MRSTNLKSLDTKYRAGSILAPGTNKKGIGRIRPIPFVHQD